MRLAFSRRAETDIEAIGDFIARDNPARAASFIAGLRRQYHTLLTFPDAHPRRDALGAGVRLAVYGRYLVFYVVHDATLEIRRVLHGARDLSGGLD